MPQPGAAEALRQARDAGVGVVLCSGRPTGYVLQKAALLGLDDGPAIAFGGAETIALPDGGTLRRVVLDADARQAMLGLAETAGLQVAAHESPQGTLRLVLSGEPAALERAAATLAESVGERVRLSRPGAAALVVQSGAATKLNALAALTKELGIDAPAVAYLGDAPDDAEALRWAGLGIALGDCVEARAAAALSAPPEQLAALLTRLALARRLRLAG